MQCSLLLSALASMVVLAVAYPMSGAITERSSEDDAILYPMSLQERSPVVERCKYHDQRSSVAMRSEDDAILYPMPLEERSLLVEVGGNLKVSAIFDHECGATFTEPCFIILSPPVFLAIAVSVPLAKPARAIHC
ncbi:hypothetical protein F4604DRAFT_1685535 [Suillus subluteus]|nr:hypothetical protein F4604DRAFT_1685535 [Suillus subluteus]